MKKKTMERTEYIISGKAYHPLEDILLMTSREYSEDIHSDLVNVSLYATKKGAFYTVSERVRADNVEYPHDDEMLEKVELISKEDALKLMDKNPAGIINDAYKSIFGDPEEG